MPRVSTPENMVGVAQPGQGRFVAADNGGGVLGAIGAGITQIGRGIDGFAVTQAQIEERHSETAARDADNKLAAQGVSILSDPTTGILNQRGQAALDAYKPATDALRKASDEISGTLTTPLAQRLFRQVSDARIATWNEGINRHVALESHAWDDDVTNAAIKSNTSDAIIFANNPKAADQSIATAQGELAKKLGRAGVPDAAIVQQQSALGSQTRLGIVKRLADGDHAGAAAYYDQYKGAFTGEDATAAENALRISDSREQAEQRRAAAEARANAAQQVAATEEQLSTAKAQLANGAGSSADWFTVEHRYRDIGDTSAAAEAHARGVEMSAAEKHRGATLPEMDARIGELNGKPTLTPDEAAERKGLVALRDQSAARINQPGGALSQLQFATGAAVQKLDSNNPATYTARATQAVAATRSYGLQTVEPLTQPEARPIKQQVASGDSKQRLAALDQISRFSDPRAIDGAARQVSEKGDGAFRIAATLSTLPGDYGHQAARDMLRGAEAAKTNAAAYLPAQARTSFTSYAAPALKGMSPDYAADVQTAARDLYFERMRQAGKTAWDENVWHDSIDTALGSYTHNGIKYGGVTTDQHSNAVSVPPGWTGSGVFGRLARASAAEWSQAGTAGAPVWPDGSGVTNGQLRDLTPVRLGGTSYAFQTRNGRFLGTKSGQPYQVDVAKLPWHP